MAPKIPANAALLFEVELVGVKPKEASSPQLQKPSPVPASQAAGKGK